MYRIWFTFVFLVFCCNLQADPPSTLRLDYYHTGNTKQMLFAVEKFVLEPTPWPGNTQRSIDDSNLGEYRFQVIDPAEKKVLYSRGFCSVFGEWVTTAEAKAVNRTFHESLRFPAPKVPVQILVHKRDANNEWEEVWQTKVDAATDRTIDTSIPESPGELIEIENHGPSVEKVDLLLLGDGYTIDEQAKFAKDARRMIGHLFATSPFKERRKEFNVWGLCPSAKDSGISRPSIRIHRSSPLGTSYDIFGLERYILTLDNKSFRRIASFAPYDFVCILVNSRTYGGGGIFGQYSTVAVDNAYAPYVFVHEFGHHFAGLADEYYTSPVAYLPPVKKIEPWEPNVTALLDPAKLKWNDLVHKDTPLPTSWKKEEYEKQSRIFQHQRGQIRNKKLSESEMEALMKENQKREQEFFQSEKYAKQIGAFEGANYAAQGYYRSEVNCIMFTRTDFFCTVCKRAIEKVIDQYTMK